MTYSFDISILANFLSIDLIWQGVQWCHRIIKGAPLKSSRGNQTFIWGSNKFIGCPNILAVANKPTIKVEPLGRRLYLSADFYDRDNKLVIKIVRNKIKVNKNNIFEIKEWKRDKLKLVNQYNEEIEVIAHKTGAVELNGTFYCNGNKFSTSSSGGLQIN